MTWAIAISLWIVGLMSFRKIWREAIGLPIHFIIAVSAIDLWLIIAGIWEVAR